MKQDQRIHTLQEKLRQNSLNAAFLFYSRDIFYYTGTAQPSYLAVLPDDYFLFIKSGYDFAVRDVFIDRNKVLQQRRLESIYLDLGSSVKGERIGTELDLLPANQLFEFQNVFAGCEFVDISPLVLAQRKTKDPTEISKIRKACEVIEMGHQALLSNLRDGITELELAAVVENAHRLAGHEGVFFIRKPDFFMGTGPLSAGENLLRISGVVYSISGIGLSASVPAGPSKKKISKGDPVVLDIPVCVEGYHADQTRTYVMGKANENVQAMHMYLKEISDCLIEQMRPGIKCSAVYQLAMERSRDMNVQDVFMSFGNGKRSRILGHGVGIELNEPPTLSGYEDSLIEEGSVIALDLHMLDERDGAVKLEDMILIKPSGNEILTKTPRKLFEVD
jgi:Xaa-Pro aminopeptidase